MTQREYDYISSCYEVPFIQFCMEEATKLHIITGQKVHLMCDAVQMQALVLTYDGQVLGKYEL